jgi:hypothetical protein
MRWFSLKWAGSEVGGGEGTAEESPPAGRETDETDYFRVANKPLFSPLPKEMAAFRLDC